MEKLRVIKAIILVSLVTFSIVSQAEKGEPGSSVNPFSDCGIGAAIFKNDVLAVSSNIIWDAGTTALTSGISSPETCNGKDEEIAAAMFILNTYVSVEEETAKGSGRHLTALLNILNIDKVDRNRVINNVRQDFAKVVNEKTFMDKSVAQKSELYYNIFMSVIS